MLTGAGLVLLGVGLPGALALWTHAFSTPRNDAWAYQRVLFDFARTGHYSLVGWGAMGLVGQVLWAAPFVVVFGPQPWVPAVAVAVLAVVGLAATYAMARSVVPRGRATAVVLTVLVLPGFLVNTSTFMSDVPAFAADVTCLALGAAAMRGNGTRWGWATAAVLVGLLGVSVREFDLAAPLAVVVVLAARDRRHLKTYVGVGAGVLVTCAAIYAWTATLAGYQHKALGLPTAQTGQMLAACYFTASFFMVPWLPAALRRSRAPLSWRGPVAAVATLCGGFLLMAGHHPLFIGNYIGQTGAEGGDVLFGARPDLFPGDIWSLMQVVALVGGALAAFLLANTRPWRRSPRATEAPGPGGQTSSLAWPRRPDGPSATSATTLVRLFTVINLALLLTYGVAVRAAVWDRYLWPVVFGVVLLLAAQSRFDDARPHARLGPGPRGWLSRLPAPALALAVAATATAAVLNSDAYDGARWSAGQDAVRAGFPSSEVDAGFEWVGSHATATAKPNTSAAGAPAEETWYDQMFPGFRECAFLSGSVLAEPSLVLMRTVTYNEIAFAGVEHMYLYAVRSADCPSYHGAHA